MIEIEKGIAPPDGRCGAKNMPYPFAKMDVGDSFFVPTADDGVRARKSATLRNYASNKKMEWVQQGRKFTVRRVDGGIRVWRIE